MTGVRITGKTLKKAHDGEFTLMKEIKILQKTLSTQTCLQRDSDFFKVPDNILPCLNGYYDMESKEFREYDEKIPAVERQIDARYVREYENEELPSDFYNILWNGLHNQALLQRYGFNCTRDRVNGMLDILAYTFIWKNFARKLFIVVGPTKTGKTTLINIMRTVFGDYGISLSSQSIMRRANQYDAELRSDISDAVGRLWIDISEIRENQVLDPAIIKNFTGQDNVTVREPYSKERLSIPMTAKFFIVSNVFPKIINVKDPALEDRIVAIDWYNTVPASQIRQNLTEQLTTPEMRDRLFTFFVRRAADIYRKKELIVHPSFAFNTHTYFITQDDNDLVAKFYEEAFIKGYMQPLPGNYPIGLSSFTIYEGYKHFICIHQLTLNLNNRQFAMKFANIAKTDLTSYVKAVHTSIGNVYIGLQFCSLYTQFNLPIPAIPVIDPSSCQPEQFTFSKKT
jgi:phage/plasmid-associated DNA primase